MFITGKRAHQNKQHTLTAYSCAFIFVSLASWPMMERNYCISPNTVIKYKFKVLVLYSTSIPLHLRGKYRTFYDSSFVRLRTEYIQILWNLFPCYPVRTKTMTTRIAALRFNFDIYCSHKTTLKPFDDLIELKHYTE